MIQTNLFTVSEPSPVAFAKKKDMCFHYTLTMMLPRDASTSPDTTSGWLFLTMENYQKPIRRDEVIKRFGLSSSSFWRFFKQYTGLNFSDYVNAVRVEKAAWLLQTTDDTISGIAYNCGFGTPSYFNDVFRQYKGITPGKLRIEN